MKISIASGKGGTGKTTLSTNLAAYLADQLEVVLVDLDVEEPNSGLFIQGKEIHKQEMKKWVPSWNADTCSLCGLCQQVCKFNAIMQLGTEIMVFPQLCHGCFACSELCPDNALPMNPARMGVLTEYQSGKLTFIESRLDIGEEQAVPLIKQTLDYLGKKTGNEIVVLIDSPPGTSCPVIEATRHSDFVILVTEPTPFGLHDVKIAVETMRSLHKSFGVVINRVGIGNDELFRYCSDENIPVLAQISDNKDIAIAYSKGKLLYKEFPEVAGALADIWTNVQQMEGQE